MKNPFGDQKIPGSYHNLQERMYKKVSANVNEQILAMMIKAYEDALNDENDCTHPSRKKTPAFPDHKDGDGRFAQKD